MKQETSSMRKHWMVLVVCCLPLLVWAQAPTGGPTTQEHLDALKKLVSEQYARVLREQLVPAGERPVTDPGAQVVALTEQLRLVSRQYLNRDNDCNAIARFKEGRIARLETTNEEQGTLLSALRAEVESLKKALALNGKEGTQAPPAAVEEK
jgi:hypothetical protein